MSTMTETSVIALVVIIGIFAIVALVIIRYGTEQAIRIWSILGVAFGAIMSYYFTNHVKDQQIEAVQQKAAVQISSAKTDALVKQQRDNAAAIVGINAALQAPNIQAERRAELQRNLEARNAIAKGYEDEISKLQKER